MSFLEKLLTAARRNDSLLCVGLDPDPALMPNVGVADFNRAIIEATRDLVCAYKPNLAFYEALGVDGWRALRETLDALREMAPEVPVIGDGKRGDVPNTAKFYAKALFETWGFDAATVSPYLGRDAIEPFVRYGERGVFLLCRTSNVGAADVQSLPANGAPVFERVAAMAREMDHHGNIGLVVGATFPEELRRVRELCPEMPLLLPGVGPQGADLELAVRYGADRNGELAIINASRQVLYASSGADFAEAARRAAMDLRDKMRRAAAARRR